MSPNFDDAMQITPEELEMQGYELHASLNHKDLVPFIQEYSKKRTPPTIAYLASNVFFMAVTVVWFLLNKNHQWMEWSDGFARFGLGIAAAFLLIPLHEYLHVLAYQSLGAKNTSYDMNLRKFYFLALADRFVASRKEFWRIALFPFVVITFMGVVAFFLVSPVWKIFVLGVLLMHTACCSGDFGLLSYFSFFKEKEVVTYDDVSEGISYFYHRRSE